MKKLIRNVASGLSMVAVLTVISCGSSNVETENVETVEVEAPVEEVVVVETELIMVHEDGFAHHNAADIEEANSHADHDHGHEGHDHGDHGHAAPQKMKLKNTGAAVKTADVTSYMQSRSFETVNVVDTESLAYPTETNQTLVAFDKKADFVGQVHVVSSNETGEVTSVIFTGKNHIDEYNVSAGLTGKEARQLRKELKHMTKDGRIFLYEEGSSIVYMMDSKNVVTGEEINPDDVDNMVIEAVVWQN